MVVVPSLNERKNDIPMLVNFFIKNECKKKGLLSKTISQNILDKFKDHDWEGNIRELKTVVSRLVSWYSSKIYVDSLPPASYQIFESPDDLEIERSQYLDEIKKYKGLYSETELLSLINWGIVVDEMKKHDNNLKKTALALGKPHEMIVEYFERGEALLFRMKTKKVA
jgi:DNA-binding NtrC family response regulator